MPSFDIVSKTDLAEVGNAIQGVVREIATRFDFKGSKSSVEHTGAEITLHADDALKLKQIQELVKGYFVRRKLDPVALDWQTEEAATGNTVRQKVLVEQGIDREAAKEIVKAVKDFEDQGASRHPGRRAAHHRQEARRPAGGDRADPRGKTGPAGPVRQFPRLTATAKRRPCPPLSAASAERRAALLGRVRGVWCSISAFSSAPNSTT